MVKAIYLVGKIDKNQTSYKMKQKVEKTQKEFKDLLNKTIKMKKKVETNEKAFKNLFNSLHPIELAILRERVLAIMEMTMDDIKENPENWERGIIHPNLMESLSNKVKEHIGFEKEGELYNGI